jgi:hypothetical protein
VSIRSRSDGLGAAACHRAALTQHGVGNLSGNPGATTRHYGTASDEMGPFLSSQDGSGQVHPEGWGPTRNRKVVGSNPTSGSITAGQRLCLALPTARWRQAVIPLGWPTAPQAPAPLRYVGVRPRNRSPVDGPPSSAHSGRNRGGRTIGPALRAGRAFARISENQAAASPPFPHFTLAELAQRSYRRRPASSRVQAGAVGQFDLLRPGPTGRRGGSARPVRG